MLPSVLVDVFVLVAWLRLSAAFAPLLAATLAPLAPPVVDMSRLSVLVWVELLELSVAVTPTLVSTVLNDALVASPWAAAPLASVPAGEDVALGVGSVAVCAFAIAASARAAAEAVPRSVALMILSLCLEMPQLITCRREHSAPSSPRRSTLGLSERDQCPTPGRLVRAAPDSLWLTPN